jgi:hypothetical protein
MKIKYSLLALGVLITAQAKASHTMWGEFAAGGSSCNRGNVSVIENGDTLAVLFDEFGVNLPQGSFGDGLTVRKTCTFRIELTPPSGFYLAGFTQLYSGGLIKNRNSSGQLTIRYNVGPVASRPMNIVWLRGDDVRPEDADSLFSKEFTNNFLVANCGGRTAYGINMTFSASRPSVRDHIVGGLDSVDARFLQKVVLIPEYRLCR